MKKYLAILCLMITVTSGFCQVSAVNKSNENPFIEVVGTASKEVIPDRIFINIVVSDKTDENKEYTIEGQEKRLRDALSKIGINLNNLVLSDAGAQVVRYKKRESVYKVSKEYTLEVKNAAEVNAVFKELFSINIKECAVGKVENSQIELLRKEVRIAAIRAAKDKAGYLLTAIGEQLDKPLEIREEVNAFLPLNYNVNNYKSNAVLDEVGIKNEEPSFQNMEIKFSYYIKYSIK